MVTTSAPLNWNSHPELDDSDFVTAAVRVLFDPGYMPSDPRSGTSHSDWVSEVAQEGRWGLISRWKSGSDKSGYAAVPGNYSDPWFANVPGWSWMVVIPVAGIVSFILLWKAYGHLIKKTMNVEGNGSDGRF
jgi:hypothetical protein